MKLIAGFRRFTIEPENDVDRALLLMIREMSPQISFGWDDFGEIIGAHYKDSICFYIDFETGEDNK